MDAKVICKFALPDRFGAARNKGDRGKQRFRTVEFEGCRDVFAATVDVAKYLNEIWNEAEDARIANNDRD